MRRVLWVLSTLLCAGCPLPGDEGVEDSETGTSSVHSGVDSMTLDSASTDTEDSDPHETGGSETAGVETAEVETGGLETAAEETGSPEMFVYGEVDAIVLGDEAGQFLGSTVAVASDVNGDALNDLWVNHSKLSPGEAWLFDGPVIGLLGRSDASAILYSSSLIYGPSSTDNLPVTSADDVDGDGFADAVFGNPGTGGDREGLGVAVLMMGPFEGEVDVDSSESMIWGVADGDYLGWSVAGPGDVDGDGLADLLLGAWGVDLPGAYADDGYCPPGDEDYGAGSEPDDGERAGETYLFFGPVSGTLSASDADGTLSGEVRNDKSGHDLAPIGDVDGDGLADLLIGAEGQCESAGGAAYVVLGPASGARNLADADGKLMSAGLDDELGGSLAGGEDIDGDGLPDLLLGAPGARELYLVQSPPLGDQSVADALVTVSGHLTTVADDIAPPGDLDGDGWVDITIDAFIDSTSGRGAGAVYGLFGPLSGTYELGAEDLILTGTAGDSLGASLDLAGDTNGDGLPDLLIGVSSSDLGATDAGAALLLLGGGAILGGL